MKRRVKLVIAVVFSILIPLSGCSRESGPVGTWQNQALPETVQFNQDHTGVFAVKDRPSLPFKWSMERPGTVRIEISYHGSAHTLVGKYEKSTFVLEGRGEKATYAKVE